MKAIVLKGFGGTENFGLEEVRDPIPDEEEVLIRIKATAFNPIDYQMRQGGPESKLLKSGILGRELSGTVVWVGARVRDFTAGDHVTAYVGSLASGGTYAEFISVPADLLAKNPGNVSFEEAAALPLVGLTALQCFKRVNIPREEPIFIAGGAGGVGTMLIKLLLANKNANIFTTAGNEESISHLLGLGLDKGRIINYKQEEVIAFLETEVGKNRFNYIFDLVGGGMSETCAELAAVYGTYVDVTFLTTPRAREILFGRASTIINIANYAHASGQDKNNLKYYGSGLAELFEKVERSIISPAPVNVIGDLGLETVREAHLLLEQNLTRGKKLVMKIP